MNVVGVEGNCPGGGMSRGEYMSEGNVLHFYRCKGKWTFVAAYLVESPVLIQRGVVLCMLLFITVKR